MPGQAVDDAEHVEDQARRLWYRRAVRQVARVRPGNRRLQHAQAEAMPGGDGDISIPAGTFVELQSGVRVDFRQRLLLSYSAESYMELRPQDGFRHDPLPGARAAHRGSSQ